MNLLAHAVLSFNDAEVQFGQLISDFVKGRKQYDYPSRIHKGIVLHRRIDTFTDEHPATRRAKEIFRPVYRLYGGAFVDISFDHFLATDDSEFRNKELFTFSQQVYAGLGRHRNLMPSSFERMFPYMEKENWLLGYGERAGMYRSFRGLVRRSVYMTDSEPAITLFDDNYDTLKNCYAEFWPQLKAFAKKEYDTIN